MKVKIHKAGDRLKCRDVPPCFLCERKEKKLPRHMIRVQFDPRSPTFFCCSTCVFGSPDVKGRVKEKFLKLQAEENQS